MTKRRKHDPEMFKSIEARSVKGESVAKLCKENNISPALFYSWRQRNKRVRTVAVTSTANAAPANTTTNTAAATAVLSLGKDSSRGYLFVGSPKFLAEVMNQF